MGKYSSFSEEFPKDAWNEQWHREWFVYTGTDERPARVFRRGRRGLCQRRRRWRTDIEHGVGGRWTGGAAVVEGQSVSGVSTGCRQWHVVAGTGCRSWRTGGQHHLVVCLHAQQRLLNSTKLNFIVTYLQLNSWTAELLNIYTSYRPKHAR